MNDSNIRILRNTEFLYIRTFLTLFISLYTSRVVLEVLGVTDLGIYNSVSGVILFLSILSSSVSKSTQRFIAFEIGKNTSEYMLKKVFSTCIYIHLMAALIVLVIGEIAGVFAVEKVLVIPPEREYAAVFVLHCCILTFLLRIIRIPYESVITANEKMDFFALLSILEVSLQLVLVLVIKYVRLDSLKLYALTLVFIELLLLSCSFFYIKSKFPAYTLVKTKDIGLYKAMISLSGWSLAGGVANILTQQGLIILLNRFVGLVANTALGFANQVYAGVNRFFNTFSTAFTPQLIKLCATNEYDKLMILMRRASKLSFILSYFIALPLIVNMDCVLHIWLGKVPQYTVDFCSLILVCAIFDATSGVFNTAITATGDVKCYQLVLSCSFILDIIISFVILFYGISPIFVLYSRIFTRGVLNFIIGVFFCRIQLLFDVKEYIKSVILPIGFTCVAPLPFVFFLNIYLEMYSKLIVSSLTIWTILFIMLWYVLLNKNERASLSKIIKNKINTCRI